MKTPIIKDYQRIYQWYSRSTRTDPFQKDKRFLSRIQPVWRQLVEDFHDPNFAQDEQMYTAG